MAESTKLYLKSSFGVLGYFNISFSRVDGTFTFSTNGEFHCDLGFYIESGDTLSIPVIFQDKFGDYDDVSGQYLEIVFNHDVFAQGGTYSCDISAARLTRAEQSVSKKFVFLALENDPPLNPTRTFEQGATIDVYYAMRKAASSYIGDQYAVLAYYSSSVMVTRTGSGTPARIFTDFCYFRCDGNNSGQTGTMSAYAELYHHYGTAWSWTHRSGDCLSYGYKTFTYTLSDDKASYTYTVPPTWNGSTTLNKYLGLNFDFTAGSSGLGDLYTAPNSIGQVTVGTPTISTPSNVALPQAQTTLSLSVTVGNVGAGTSYTIYATPEGRSQVTKTGTGSGAVTMNFTNINANVTYIEFYVVSSDRTSNYSFTYIDRTNLTLTLTDSPGRVIPGGNWTAEFEVSGNVSTQSYTITCTPDNGDTSLIYTISGTGNGTASHRWSSVHYKNNGTITFTCVLQAGSLTAPSVNFVAQAPDGGGYVYVAADHAWYYGKAYRYTNGQWASTPRGWYNDGREWKETKP